MISSHKDGYDKYMAWKRVWTSNGKTEPSPKAFMADQQLPYWVRRDTAALEHQGAMMLRVRSLLAVISRLVKAVFKIVQKSLLTQYSLRKKVMSHTASCLSTHLLMDTWVVSSFS